MDVTGHALEERQRVHAYFPVAKQNEAKQTPLCLVLQFAALGGL